jgi:hypothetical protein
MMRKYFAFALIATLGFVFTACSNSTSPPSDNTPVHAGDGSTYTYKKTETDKSGTPISADTTHTDRVIQGTHSFSGKDSAIVVIDSNAGSGQVDTTIMNYESNGDVSLYRGNGIPGVPIPIPIPIPTWWTLPIQSKSTLAIMDTMPHISIPVGPFTVTIDTVKGTATYRGDETITVGSNSYSCNRVDVTFYIGAHAALVGWLPVYLTTSYWYEPKIGYFAKYQTSNELPSALSGFGYNSQYNVQALTSYIVK